ncbi:CaM kinase-like vesicle-associated protein, partial [Charadrius vociferus]
MPFGCVTLGDKKDYNQPSEVTDRYDLGQVIKTAPFGVAVPKFIPLAGGCMRVFSPGSEEGSEGCSRAAPRNPSLLPPKDLRGLQQFRTIPAPPSAGRSRRALLRQRKGQMATGREVFDWILDQGYYSERDTSNVIRQVLEAVAYLHSLKIVHRNLKLENLVYYTRLKNSKIVISDFHLAKLENGLIKEPCGTPEYLGGAALLSLAAPEVVGRQRYGRPVDCWAIGVIMYILASHPPYWDDISQAAKELVTRLMEVEQDQRITAEEAISHEWISGNAASDKNIKDGVCAQIEKNFARAKWK